MTKLIDQKMYKQKMKLIKLLDTEISGLDKYYERANQTMNAPGTPPCADCIKFSIKIIDIIDDLKAVRAKI